jgi:GT2 family glycosyltransferase
MDMIGIVIVSYGSADVILDCLESLVAADRPEFRIVVVDNASFDGTADLIRAWAGAGDHHVSSDIPFEVGRIGRPLRLREGAADLAPDREAQVTLIEAGANLGFAGGVNVGVDHLARDPDIGHFWVLNPDSVVPAESLDALSARVGEIGRYGLMGGRVLYLERPDRIQIDGGLVNYATGVTGNHNLNSPADAPPPDPSELDFVTGASLVASRAFLERAGPMREDYFLYYEEVDWALRRGDLPIVHCPDLIVYHRAGTAIGSPKAGQSASPFSLYFKHRGRMRFLRRFNPKALPVGYAYGLVKAAGLMRRGERAGARAILAAIHGRPAPEPIASRLSEDACRRAFAPFRA